MYELKQSYQLLLFNRSKMRFLKRVGKLTLTILENLSKMGAWELSFMYKLQA